MKYIFLAQSSVAALAGSLEISEPKPSESLLADIVRRHVGRITGRSFTYDRFYYAPDTGDREERLLNAIDCCARFDISAADVIDLANAADSAAGWIWDINEKDDPQDIGAWQGLDAALKPFKGLMKVHKDKEPGFSSYDGDGPNNEQRAEWGADALAGYATNRKGDGDPQTDLQDLLGDLMHYADFNKLDFHRALRMGQDTYKEEVAEEKELAEEGE